MIEKFRNMRDIFFKLDPKKVYVPFLLNTGIFIAISLIIFFMLFGCLASQNERSRNYLIQSIDHSLDLFFLEMNSLCDNIDEAIVNFEDSPTSHQETMKLINTLRNKVATSRYIENIVIMQKNSPTLYTALGTIEKNVFFNKHYYNTKYDNNFWDVTTANNLHVEIKPSSLYENKTIFPSNKPQQLLTLYRSKGDEHFTIIIYADEEKMLDYLNIKSKETNIGIALFDQYSTLLMNKNIDVSKANTKLPSNQSRKSYIVGLKKYLLIKNMDYNFLYLVEFDNNIYLILTLVFLLLTAVAATTLLLTKKIAFASFTPMQRIIDLLELPSGHTFDDLAGKLIHIKKDYACMTERLSLISDSIIQGTFSLLLTESKYYSKNKNAVLAKFEEIAFFDLFVLLLIEGDAAKSYIKKVKEHLPCIATESGYNYYVLLGLSSEKEYKTTKDKLIELAENRRDILIFASKTFESFSELCNANNDIAFYRSHITADIISSQNLITENDIKTDTKIFLPSNIKEELTSYLLSNNIDAAKKYLNEIIDKNTTANIQFFRLEHLFRILYHCIADTISTSCDDSEFLEYEKIFVLQIEKFKKSNDTEKFKIFFNNILSLFITYSKKKNNVTNHSEIIQYLNNNYHKDISLDTIADLFQTTPKYFSNFFKKAFGICFSDYLTQIRISHAKEYMENTDMPLNQIAESVGYLNHSTFSIAFKKITSMSPSKYRSTKRKLNG